MAETSHDVESAKRHGRLFVVGLILLSFVFSALLWVTYTTDADELDAPDQIGPPERTGLIDD